MRFYKKMYGGTKCKFDGQTYRVEKLEGDKVFINFDYYSSFNPKNFIYVSQLEQFTDEEIQEFKDDDMEPRIHG